MISIICPVYNSEKYLVNCIESVIQQIFDDWELILVDDESTDSSPIICSYYSKLYPNIRYYKKHHQGQWATREYGISKCCGDYFIFLDSDDYLEKDALSTINDVIYEKKVDVVLYDFSKLFSNGLKSVVHKHSEEKYVLGNKEIVKYCFLTHNCISLCIYCFKKSFYDSYYISDFYDKSIKNQEDFLMLTYLMNSLGKMYVIPRSLYVYRYNPSSVTNSMIDKDYYKAIFVADEIYRNLIDKYNFTLKDFSHTIKSRLSWLPLSFIKRAYTSTQYKLVLHQFKEIKKTFLYNSFTKKTRFTTIIDRIIMFFFKLNLHFVNRFLIRHVFCSKRTF